MGIENHEDWAEDAQVLQEVGRALYPQIPKVEVRIDHRLADQAVAAWQREEDEGDLQGETAEQQCIRDQAASLALIGLAIDETGLEDGDEVVFEVDAWLIGRAPSAAEDAGRLNDTSPPSS